MLYRMRKQSTRNGHGSCYIVDCKSLRQEVEEDE
jgi:hypothetical protein